MGLGFPATVAMRPVVVIAGLFVGACGSPRSKPAPAGTCSNPIVASLASGENEFTGSFDGAVDNGTGSCENGVRPDVVYELTLPEPADLRIGTSGIWPLVVRAGSCQAGQEIGCGDGLLVPAPYPRMGIFDLAAGTYYFLLERDPSDSATTYSLTISVERPPTPRPENDRCTGAEQLDLSTGTATATGSFLAAVPEATSSCGWSTRALYYSFRLSSPTVVQLSIDNNDDAYELRSGSCDTSTQMFCGNTEAFCGTVGWSPDVLPVGDYIVRLNESNCYNPKTHSLSVKLTVSTLPPPSGR